MASSDLDEIITGEILYQDVLLKVFPYLSTSDLLSAARVCKEWKKAVDCKTSWRGRSVHIDLTRQFDDRFIFTFVQRGIEYLTLGATDSEQLNRVRRRHRIQRIMQCFTPTLRQLKIKNMRLYDRDISAVFSDKMDCLEKLEFSHVLGDIGRNLVQVSEQCPKLQHLKTYVRIPPSLIRTLGTNMPNLKTINVIGTSRYNNAAMEDIRTKMPDLERLTLNRSLLDDVGISQLAMMRGLMSLKLDRCASVTAEAIKILGQARSPIEILAVTHCRRMHSNSVLCYIGQYSLAIKKLTVYNNMSKITNAGFRGLLRAKPCLLKKLYVSNTAVDIEQAAKDLTKNAPNLVFMKFYE